MYYLDMPTDLEPRYSLTELAQLAGVTPRTVRYYVSQGLLAVEVTPGPGPKYSDAHLARLRLIRRLQREHQPLAEIRRRLDDIDDATILALDAEEAPTPPSDSALDYIARVTGATTHPSARGPSLLRRIEAATPATPAAADASVMPVPRLSMSAPTAPAAPAPDDAGTPRLERSQWERIDLAPDVELHVRRPLPRTTSKQVDRLVSIARDLFREENP